MNHQRVWGLVVLLWLVGCVPATVPPQLGQSVASGVIVTQDRYSAPDFSVMRPDGWRVITSPAEAPYTVIFSSPDNISVIRVSSSGAQGQLRPTALDADTPLVQLERQVMVEGREIRLYGSAAADDAAQLAAWLDRLEASL